MAFILYDASTLCEHRIAGRLLARLAGLGGLSIHDLAALMGVCERAGYFV